LFVDLDGEPMRILFKLYPWEWIMREDFGANIKLSGALYQAFARPGYFDGHYADIGAWMVAK
jgi:glutathionylspermidine synthase